MRKAPRAHVGQEIVKGLCLFLSFLLLANCSGRALEEAEALTPRGSPYQQLLYQGYLELAAMEQAGGNYTASDHFAQKASLAAQGQTPLPDNVDPTKVPPDRSSELLGASDRLSRLTLSTMAPEDFEPLAVAQLAFDCWYQRQQDPVATPQLESCRDDFYVALEIVESSPFAAKADPNSEPLFQLNGDAMVGLVPFDFGGAEISPEGRQILSRIVERAQEQPDKKVRVVAHTDTVGSTDFNQALAERRANAVILFLVQAGIDPTRIVSEAVGENQLLELTSDNVRSQANRVAVVDLI